MPKNNFKLFDENKSNMMTDVDYNINQQRLNGVQSGVASSQLQNKTLYQTALMCYALAQLMAANGYDANDADAVSTFVNNLSLSMVQKVVDKASANDVAKHVAGKWVDAKQLGELKTDVADNYLPLLGGTMLGDLILHGDPVFPLQAVTKQYVDGYTGKFIKKASGFKSVEVDISDVDKSKANFLIIDIAGVEYTTNNHFYIDETRVCILNNQKQKQIVMIPYASSIIPIMSIAANIDSFLDKTIREVNKISIIKESQQYNTTISVYMM